MHWEVFRKIYKELTPMGEWIGMTWMRKRRRKPIPNSYHIFWNIYVPNIQSYILKTKKLYTNVTSSVCMAESWDMGFHFVHFHCRFVDHKKFKGKKLKKRILQTFHQAPPSWELCYTVGTPSQGLTFRGPSRLTCTGPWFAGSGHLVNQLCKVCPQASEAFREKACQTAAKGPPPSPRVDFHLRIGVGIRTQHSFTTRTHAAWGSRSGKPRGDSEPEEVAGAVQPQEGRQAALPCTLTHSVGLKALCRPMAFTNVRAFTQYAAPGSTVSRYTGRTPGLTTLMCSFRKPENSHTLSQAGQERERRREGKLSILPFQHAYIMFLSFFHLFIHSFLKNYSFI